MKEILKRIFGIEGIERSIAEKRAIAQAAEEERQRAEKAAEEARAKEAEAKMSPKERATFHKQPWIGVLDTHVNKDNIRNGFFELDWNEYFIVELKRNGYGLDGDPEEETVDRWFRDIVRNILAEEGQDVSRGSGFINVNKLQNGRSEVK
jgi:hypothetical protein